MPGEMEKAEKKGGAEAITVGMRMRPLIGAEKGEAHCLIIKDNVVTVVDLDKDKEKEKHKEAQSFAFDFAMDSTDPSSPNFVNQEKCYELMGQRMLESMVQGYNACLFCYGQTGTGKTTTIMGQMRPKEEQGILVRLISDIFAEVEKMEADGCKVEVKFQMIEVYNEKLSNLLDRDKKKVDVHVHPELGVYLTGVNDHIVKDLEMCIQLIDFGNSMKTVHATAMNAQSSRGHTIIKINLEKSGGTEGMTTSSEVFFADLAGRENERTTQVTGDRLTELTFINRSLMFLSTCIQALGGGGPTSPDMQKRRQTVTAASIKAGGEQAAAHKPAAHPPKKDMGRFRNSKLTLLLSNALSGNSRTAMIGTLSPAQKNFEESFSTLKFAATVKNIKLEAKAATAVDKESLIGKLEEEVKALKRQLAEAQAHPGALPTTQHEDLGHEVAATEELLDNLKTPRDPQQEQLEHATRLRVMEKRRYVNNYDPSAIQYPHLANWSDDPYLANKLVYTVPADGEEKSIGSDEDCTFNLLGLSVLPVTAVVRNSGTESEPKLEIKAAMPKKAILEKNGKKVGDKFEQVHHLDCLLFGRSTIFYALLKSASPEELAEAYMRHGRAPRSDGNDDEEFIKAILGEDRSAHLEMQLARQYLAQLRKEYSDAQGSETVNNFLTKASDAQKLIDEANEMTHQLRRDKSLTFELVAQAPVLSMGYGGIHSKVPELAARLTHRPSHGKHYWTLVRSAVDTSTDDKESESQDTLFTWSWRKFEDRLTLMRSVFEEYEDGQEGFKIDPMNDPWAEYGPGDMAEVKEGNPGELWGPERMHQLYPADRVGGEGALTASTALEEEHEEDLHPTEAEEVRHLRQENEELRREVDSYRHSYETLQNKWDIHHLPATMRSGEVAVSVDKVAVSNGNSRWEDSEALARLKTCLEVSAANAALVKRLLEGRGPPPPPPS